MIDQYTKFLSYLDQENKDEAIKYIHQLLDSGESLVNVYEHILIPSLADYHCQEEESLCIWKEHTRTSIIRTILESTYIYLLKEKKEKRINKKIVVACPQEEYHEIGAIIATNYFYLMGYDVKYIGANTPHFEIKSAIEVLKPDYLALSITNYYNITQTKKLLEEIKQLSPQLKIILGGQAALKYANQSGIPYDYILDTYQSIVQFRGEDHETRL